METLLEYLKKSGSHAELRRALRKELESAKDIQRARLLKYVNAGHNPPVVARPANGSVDLFHLKSANVPIGMSADSQFSTMTFRLQIDDILVAYTDGITEAEDHEGQPWGEQALEELMCTGSSCTTKEVVGGILAKLSAFTNGQPQRDDMTLVVLKAVSTPTCSSTTSDRRDGSQTEETLTRTGCP